MFSAATYQQLLEEDNVALRAGVIGGAASIGYMMGALRGRIFRRLFYASLGAGTAAAVCYPEEAKVLAAEAETEGMRAGQIAYNFVFGGKTL